ncbi:hypothetical protein [Mycoplasma struthionis]|uniref:Uncharacterized protein n=1 Tax=Mycoplasma struthionis TaxID=538220 RepID=A0A502M3P1_9MOLU|nr:hypothetical protein [Mycoplasma struthionis]TPI01578.1 hypothetical protein FJM01_02355 [Mycoplasma struthionis]
MEKIKIENLENQSLQFKRDFIAKYCMYSRLQKHAGSLKQKNVIQTKNDLEIFIESLSADYKKIFVETFVLNNSDSSWYLRYFSKNDYYRKLNFVVNLFIRFIHATNNSK